MAAMPADCRRKALRRRRGDRRAAALDKYKEYMAELFHLQSAGAATSALILDFPAFKKKPTAQYINFLKSNHAPEDIMKEVRKAAGIKEPTQQQQTPQVQQASSPVKRPAGNVADDLPARKVVRPPPKAVPPPPPPTVHAPPPQQQQPRQWSSSSSVSPAVRAALASKMRQEAYVVRRVAELTRDGMWSAKKLPKVCERPRPKTQWDAVLGEMQWMAVDFYQVNRI